jgi:hypothetical protein
MLRENNHLTCVSSILCEILGSHSGAAEYASLVGCDAAATTCQGDCVTSRETCVFSSVLGPSVI